MRAPPPSARRQALREPSRAIHSALPRPTALIQASG
jgi:hypothetical protein